MRRWRSDELWCFVTLRAPESQLHRGQRPAAAVAIARSHINAMNQCALTISEADHSIQSMTISPCAVHSSLNPREHDNA